MGLFDKQIQNLRRQFGGLETSQRVALGLCVIILSAAILMLTQWSLERQMVLLYADPMTPDQVASAGRQLQSMGETYEMRGDDIFVRPNDQARLIMALNARNSGPTKLNVTFEKLLKDKNTFASAATTRNNYNLALGNELALMIQAWSKVSDARVQIAPATRQRLGQRSTPTAAVQVRLVSGTQFNKSIVESLARMVAGAVPGLEPQHVNIIDQVTGRPYRVDDPEDQFGGDLYELQRQQEQALKTKIEELLSYIPGVLAQVELKLDDKVVSSVETKLDEPAVKRETKDETSKSRQSPTPEPGVQANTGAALQAGTAGQNDTTEKTETDFMENRGGTVTQTDQKPGTVLKAAASIGVPRSYFIGALKALQGGADEPQADEIATYIEEQIPLIQNQVQPILDANAEQESTVVVSVFADQAATFITPTPLVEPAEAGSVMDFVSANGKQIGLFSLAILAMGMMLTMARKSGTPVATQEDSAADVTAVGPLGDLYVDDGAIGKAGSPDAFLIAQETDENSIRTRQISKQVSDLINDDPDGAAQLVRRWIEREL
jgi:flagellar M-ring protein FliF